MLAILKTLLARLNPHAVHLTLLVVACVVGLLAMVGGATYFAADVKRWHLGRSQVKAETAHAQRVATAAARTTAYSIDSAAAATSRRYRLREDSILAQTDAHLSTTRPARVHLPASPEPGN